MTGQTGHHPIGVSECLGVLGNADYHAKQFIVPPNPRKALLYDVWKSQTENVIFQRGVLKWPNDFVFCTVAKVTLTKWARMVKFLPVILFLFLPGCAPGMGSVGWPVEQYDMAACTMMPMEPSCLSLAGVQGGFKYGGQFNACKQSLQNFIDANERYYNCTSQKLKKIFDDLIKKSTNSYGCLVANYKKSEEDLYKNCSLVSEPEFRQRYEADGIEYNFGIPRCLQKNISLASGMFLEIRLSECKKQLETFSNDGLFAAGLDAASAQKQYDTYTRNLKKKIERNAEDALRRFNCFAERRDFCT